MSSPFPLLAEQWYICTGGNWCLAYVPTWAAAPHAHCFIANATNSLGCAVFVVTSWKKSMHQMMKLFLLLAGTIVFSAELAACFLLLLLIIFPPFWLLFKYFTAIVHSWISSPTHFQQFCWVCIFSMYTGLRLWLEPLMLTHFECFVIPTAQSRHAWQRKS